MVLSRKLSVNGSVNISLQLSFVCVNNLCNKKRQQVKVGGLLQLSNSNQDPLYRSLDFGKNIFVKILKSELRSFAG